jgi:hypothetical protein
LGHLALPLGVRSLHVVAAHLMLPLQAALHEEARAALPREEVPVFQLATQIRASGAAVSRSVFATAWSS